MPPIIPDFLADAPAPQGTALGADDAPTSELRATSSRPPLDPVHQAVVDERKAARHGIKARPTRDALIQLQYRNVARIAPRVMARLEKALDNEDDPLHEMVVEKLMQRVVPNSFWESLAKQEFAEDAGDKRPVFNITIGAAAAPKIEHQPVVVDVKAREVK